MIAAILAEDAGAVERSVGVVGSVLDSVSWGRLMAKECP